MNSTPGNGRPSDTGRKNGQQAQPGGENHRPTLGLQACDGGLSSRPQVPLPLLVTGVAGVAGLNAFELFRQEWGDQVIGIRQKNNWPLSRPGIVGCNAEDKAGLAALFDKHQFRAVLNCAGNCALRACELDPALARRTNVAGVENLLNVIEGRDVRLVHLSIDLVFSGGGAGGYRENAIPDPVTVYGKTMVEAENLVLARRPQSLILRISLPMAPSFNGHAGAIDWIQSRFKKDKPATLYFDEIRTPTYCDCLNSLFEDVLGGDLAGLYHAGGPRAVSLYEIAQVINRVGGYDPDLLMGCPRLEAGPIPPRAGNVSMDSSALANALGYAPFDPWPYHHEWVPTHREWHYDRGGDSGSAQLLAELLYRNPRRK